MTDPKDGGVSAEPGGRSGRPVVFERGVRLRREQDGTALLLVPEGIVRLNESAAAALALVDGRRTIDDIATELAAAPFDADGERIASDVRLLFQSLRERRFLKW